MRISSVSLEGIGPFENISLRLNPGINVFIGANGSGKSILMKLMYAFLRSAQPSRSIKLDRAQRLYDKAAGVLEPRSQNLSRVIRRKHGRSTGTMTVKIGNATSTVKFGANNSLELFPTTEFAAPPRAVFLPTKEMLSWYRGFAELYRDSKIDLEETYLDLAEDLGYPSKRAARPAPWGDISQKIRTAIGGSVTVRNEEFVHKTVDGTIEANLMAEGHRKLGTLYHLVQNGRLEESSTLFWDEPETNLNPALMREVVALLRMLADAGLQIFVATHDYTFARLLSLPAEFGLANKVTFHGFAREVGRSGPVVATSAPELFDLPPQANLLPDGIDTVVQLESDLLRKKSERSR